MIAASYLIIQLQSGPSNFFLNGGLVYDIISLRARFFFFFLRKRVFHQRAYFFK